MQNADLRLSDTDPAPPELPHRSFPDVPDWTRIPGWEHITSSDFLSHTWQARSSVTKVETLWGLLDHLVDASFADDVVSGLSRAPMSLRISPYILSLIDWTNPYTDPLRIQFLPVASKMLPDHPKLTLDSLHEQEDSPVPGLTHRYHDKALFLPLDTCPVYCRFCTRSYAVGLDTELVEKLSLKVNPERWQQAFEYIARHPEVEDVVVSGGDAFQLRPSQLQDIGDALLTIPHVRRLRIATKGLAVLPMKITSDSDWTDSLSRVVDKARKLGVEVAVHTHFNHPNEITGISQRATQLLFERGITVRNQTVLIRGVNDSIETMTLLIKRLGYINVHPYYVYVHDLVKGCEDLRTSLSQACEIERGVRGCTAGFNTPTFVVDLPGGGGKRDIHSYEAYNHKYGISVFTAPSVKPDQVFTYYDPLHTLSQATQFEWNKMPGVVEGEERAMLSGL